MEVFIPVHKTLPREQSRYSVQSYKLLLGADATISNSHTERLRVFIEAPIRLRESVPNSRDEQRTVI